MENQGYNNIHEVMNAIERSCKERSDCTNAACPLRVCGCFSEANTSKMLHLGMWQYWHRQARFLMEDYFIGRRAKKMLQRAFCDFAPVEKKLTNRRKTMKEIINILMERDGLSLKEAKLLILETRNMILSALENGDDPEEVLADMLGLEPDYILEFI